MIPTTLKKSLLIATLSTSIFATSAFAVVKGGDSGGGGDSLIDRKTGELISIADPMAQKEVHFKRFKLNEATLAEIKKSSPLLHSYGFNLDFFRIITSEENVDYRLVEEIPAIEKCNERLKYAFNENEYVISKSACTIGRVTFFKKADYEKLLAKKSKQELFLLIFHEGLRRIPNLNSDDLVALTNGARTLLNVFSDQMVNTNRTLDQKEKDSIKDFMDTAAINGFWTYEFNNVSLSQAKAEVAKNTVGDHGARHYGITKNPVTSKFGVGSVITPDLEVGENVIVMGSMFSKCNLGKNTKILNSTLNCINGSKIGEDTIIQNSNVDKLIIPYFERKEPSNSTQIGSRVKILNSTLSGTSKIGNDVEIKNVDARFECVKIENDVSLINMKKAVIFADAQGLWGGLKSGLRSSRVIFKEGTRINLNNEIACEGTENYFSPAGGAYTEIRTTNDLIRTCVTRD